MPNRLNHQSADRDAMHHRGIEAQASQDITSPLPTTPTATNSPELQQESIPSYVHVLLDDHDAYLATNNEVDQELNYDNEGPRLVEEETKPPPPSHPGHAEQVVDLTKSTSPQPQSLSGQPTASRLLTPVHNFRVQKHTNLRASPATQQTRSIPRQQQSTGRPSEEDLLFLLMARARQNAQARQHANVLEKQNKSLQKRNAQITTELEKACNARDVCFQNNYALQKNLEVFKEKYYKLKNWAIETNEDCEVLSEKASGLRHALADLMRDRDRLTGELRDMKTSSVSVADQLSVVRKCVSDVKILAEDRVAAVTKMGAIVEAQKSSLLYELHRNQKFEAHIKGLEHIRKLHADKAASQQHEVHKTLQTLSQQLDQLHTGQQGKSTSAACISETLARIQTAVENDLTKKSDLIALTDAHASTQSAIYDAKAGISAKIHDATVSIREDLEKGVATQAQELLFKLQSENNQLVEARLEVSRLREKASATDQLAEFTQAQRDLTNQMCESTRNIFGDLLAKMNKDDEACQKQLQEFSNKLSELIAQSSQLHEYKSERDEARTQAEALSVRLDDSHYDLGVLQSTFGQAEAIIAELRTRLGQECALKARQISDS
jgi:hypothetical protein